MLMHGQPDDTPGGHLIMSEYDVHVRNLEALLPPLCVNCEV